MINGRRKGNAAEREIAQTLEEWWQRHEQGVQFVRTPLSGGWSSAKVRGEFRASGDLMTTSATFPFVVEVKRREAFSMERFLEGRQSPVWGWWAQACTAAKEQQGRPLLWLRKNGEPWALALETGLEGALVQRRLLGARFVRGRVEVPHHGLVSVLAPAALLAVPPGALLETLAGLPPG